MIGAAATPLRSSSTGNGVTARLHVHSRLSKALMTASLLAVAGLVGAALPVRTALAVRSQSTRELRFATPMEPGEEFVISYVHSVNRRPVHDTLRVERAGLRIVKSVFDAFGAGIPETASEGHPLRRRPDGWLEYTVDRSVDEVTLFVGRVADHQLTVKHRVIPLNHLEAPGSAVRFSVEKLSSLQLWRHG